MLRLLTIFLGIGLVVILLVVIGSGSLLMLSSSSTDTIYSFNSPSNARVIRLIETCRGDICTHQAIITQTASDGSVVRDIRCGLDIATDRPVFTAVGVDWMHGERGVMISYDVSRSGVPAYSLDFARDCNG